MGKGISGGYRVVALEEHYGDPHVRQALGRPESALTRRLEEFGAARLQDMDQTGIDVQVVSHSAPGFQALTGAEAVALARTVNDRLADMMAVAPDRFAAFASLPTGDPEAAADELEHAVVDLKFKGANINGLTQGRFLDEPEFRPLLARAAALGVPIYLHPSFPHPEVSRIYYGDYARTHPMFETAGWGATVETGTMAMRLVLSGVLDEHPGLQFILGHLGEGIPYLMERIDETLARDTPMKDFRRYFTKHFSVTTSGFFSDTALALCIAEMGIDRVMFAVDWPYVSNRAAVDWFSKVDIDESARHRILSANAARLLGL
ncbi:amidohydrolase family protein [Pseudooceanicola sp. 216_PA32_1]|uniref:Amidohydrolase family protein n=1 Tax=Pseudooceanicola pacificus TaxID=2676438 RepID=A0A844WB08_9RHOB|nr:amidohydrolase family protein [Pseudooceanicola pacificus]MWB78263.1 amidohydrolase family protein [Pseudooceanicola pacificus]